MREPVLAILVYKKTYTADSLHVWGEQQPEILLYPGEGDDSSPHHKGRPDLQHLALEVDDRQTVDKIHQAIVAGGCPPTLSRPTVP